MIAATFNDVFGEVHLFRDHFKTQEIPLALVGFKEGGLEWDTVSRRCDFERRQGRLLDPACRHPECVAMFYLGKYRPSANARGLLNTLGNLRVEIAAGRHLLGGDPNEYYRGSCDSWLRFIERQLATLETDREMPESLRRSPGVGLLATRWEIASEQKDASGYTLPRTRLTGIPSAIRFEVDADWSFWAGRGLWYRSVRGMRLPWPELASADSRMSFTRKAIPPKLRSRCDGTTATLGYASAGPRRAPSRSQPAFRRRCLTGFWRAAWAPSQPLVPSGGRWRRRAGAPRGGRVRRRRGWGSERKGILILA
jgi:hypothetical protein